MSHSNLLLHELLKQFYYTVNSRYFSNAAFILVRSDIGFYKKNEVNK